MHTSVGSVLIFRSVINLDTCLHFILLSSSLYTYRGVCKSTIVGRKKHTMSAVIHSLEKSTAVFLIFCSNNSILAT